MIHEIGHALGLKHPHDFGTVGFRELFPRRRLSGARSHGDAGGAGAALPADMGDNDLNQKLYTIMSYNEARPSASLPFGGAPGGPMATPMAFDIAAIQQLYGANTSAHGGNDTYTLPEPGAANGTAWQCIWDTGGTDQVVYNGNANAVIDLRPATLDDSSTGGGMGSYTWSHTAVGAAAPSPATSPTRCRTRAASPASCIENAWGGNGNDLITGNAADNLLHGLPVRGYPARRWMATTSSTAMRATIVMDGGAGADRFIFELNFGADRILSSDTIRRAAGPAGLAATGATQASFAASVASPSAAAIQRSASAPIRSPWSGSRRR